MHCEKKNISDIAQNYFTAIFASLGHQQFQWCMTAIISFSQCARRIFVKYVGNIYQFTIGQIFTSISEYTCTVSEFLNTGYYRSHNSEDGTTDTVLAAIIYSFYSTLRTGDIHIIGSNYLPFPPYRDQDCVLAAIIYPFHSIGPGLCIGSNYLPFPQYRTRTVYWQQLFTLSTV
jgi:hypothetical protein